MASNPHISQNYSIPLVSPNAAPTVSIGAASIQVLAENMQRQGRVIFHNPNYAANVNLWICPQKDLNGTAVAAAVGGPGSMLLVPGDRLIIEAPCTSGFNAIAESGTTNKITIWEF